MSQWKTTDCSTIPTQVIGTDLFLHFIPKSYENDLAVASVSMHYLANAQVLSQDKLYELQTICNCSMLLPQMCPHLPLTFQHY